MFMEVAIGAIGIGIVLMVGYLIVAQVRAALPASDIEAAYANQCLGLIGSNQTGAACHGSTLNNTWYGSNCGTEVNLTGFNTTQTITCTNQGLESGLTSAQTTVFAGFGLVAVGIIVLAAFGLITIFRN